MPHPASSQASECAQWIIPVISSYAEELAVGVAAPVCSPAYGTVLCLLSLARSSAARGMRGFMLLAAAGAGGAAGCLGIFCEHAVKAGGHVCQQGQE